MSSLLEEVGTTHRVAYLKATAHDALRPSIQPQNRKARREGYPLEEIATCNLRSIC